MQDKANFFKQSLIVSTVAFAVSIPVLAQDRATAIEEVIVTAQKRSESLQDTPISISAFNKDSLEAIGLTEANEIGGYVPNVQMTKPPGSNDNIGFNIRGLGGGASDVMDEGSVALYMDGVLIPRGVGAAVDLVDLERIEILRGPQGALYGRNTIGGAVNLITEKPSDDFGFKQRFTVGNRDYFLSNTSIDTGKQGDFAAKISYHTKEKDGQVKNTVHGNDLGHTESEAFRLAVRWTPSDQVTVDYTYDKSEREGNANADQVTHMRPQNLFLGGPVWKQAATEVSKDRRGQISAGGSPGNATYANTDAHTLTIQWDLNNGMTLKSITGQREWDGGVSDTQFGGGWQSPLPTGSFLGPIPAGTYLPLFGASRDSETESFTQELQLQGSILDDRLDYTVGIYYFDEENIEVNPQTILAPGLFFGGSFGTDFQLGPLPFIYGIETSSIAAYGQFTYAATEALDLTVGLRWTRDQKDVFLDKSGQGIKTKADNDWKNFSPSFTANYSINDDVSIYATYSKGYRAGGYNARAADSSTFVLNFDEELVTNYEAGIKSDWFDSRLRVNASIFHYDYDDAQVTQFVAGAAGASSIITNAGVAQNQGIELEITALPVAGLLIAATYGYQDSKYVEFESALTDPVTANAAPSAAADALGNEDISGVAKRPSTPANTGSLIIAYDFEPTDYGNWRVQVDGTYTGKMVFHPQLNRYDSRDDQTRLNARLTLSDIPVSKGNLSVAAWVKNINNEEHREWGIDFGAFVGITINTYQELRSYGFDITYEM
tara:strand:+ start:35 stop:2359 length:2325 start_codon:yes stop_codon:yes gene_type:complete